MKPVCLALAVAAAGVLVFAASAPRAAGGQPARQLRLVAAHRHRTGPCGLTAAAFCATFDRPAGIGNRSGQLDGVVWGVSRQLGFFNLGQHQYDAAVRSLQIAGSCPRTTVTVESDIEVCDGKLNEVVNDNPDVTVVNQDTMSDDGTVTSLAMYPKQPFDFAGRTGRVVFDVSDDSGGSHAAWPEFWITGAPAPDPFAHLSSLLARPPFRTPI